MAINKTRPMTGVERDANILLASIASARAALDILNVQMEREISQVQGKYADRIAKQRPWISTYDMTLRATLKARKDELFTEDRDRVGVPNGVLLYKVRKPVKRTKRLRDNLARGFWFLFRPPPPPSINWDVIDNLNDPALKILEAKRGKKESFEYSLQT